MQRITMRRAGFSQNPPEIVHEHETHRAERLRNVGRFFCALLRFLVRTR
jgi:hypothetical protein